jgi:hypothetical protein
VTKPKKPETLENQNPTNTGKPKRKQKILVTVCAP